jgi:5-methylcytosine-specific restriction endonuclease McrA
MADRSREWRQANREKVRAQKRRHWDKHKDALNARRLVKYHENPDPQRAKSREWGRKNPERALERAKRAYLANTEKIRAYHKAWYSENREKVYATIHARRARYKGSHTAEQWEALCATYGHGCLCCGSKTKKLTRDHVIPISAGGSNEISNIQPLCLPCNLRKGRRVIDYRQSRDVA